MSPAGAPCVRHTSGIRQTVAARTACNLNSGAAAATFSVFLHRGRARSRCATFSLRPRPPFLPLSHSLFLSGVSPCPSPPLVSSTRSAPLARSLSPCVYQVIGCEMKSNENPFRRVHSRSTVGRVARPPFPARATLFISPLSLSRSSHPSGVTVPPYLLSILVHTYASPPGCPLAARGGRP